MTTSENILVQFTTLTGKDIQRYLTNVTNFFSVDYVNILQYFQGSTENISSQPFKNLEKLVKQTALMFGAFHDFGNQMNDSRYWELLELIENIDDRLKTTKHLNKWCRSSQTNFAYSPTTQLNWVLQQNQTLERVARDLLGSTEDQDSWVNIALNNNLEEEGYTSNGGVDLLLQPENSMQNIQVESVVDTMVGKSIYGKDLNAVFKITTDINGYSDVAVLGYDATVLQAVQTLVNLKKNDLPDQPDVGLQKAAVVGSNRALMNFPVVIRQLSETFSIDDSLKQFTVDSLRIVQDNVTVEFRVWTRLDEVISSSAILS